ncbi:MAG: Glutathione-dependent formaldehyde-activating enzyme [Stenotrophomonas maltophilia]|nr:MAG: Glutathione-dependent formaldehyde-activating enzyme [Stenotrophomonas maltophilia]
MQHAQCLCGGIAFELHGPLPAMQVCHCSQCRRAQGGPFATNLPVPREAFRLQRGAELLQAYSASPGKRRWFCRQCGSPIYSERDSAPGMLRVRAGLLDGQPVLQREAQYHVASRARWWPLDDDLPSVEEGRGN